MAKARRADTSVHYDKPNVVTASVVKILRMQRMEAGLENLQIFVLYCSTSFSYLDFYESDSKIEPQALRQKTTLALPQD